MMLQTLPFVKMFESRKSAHPVKSYGRFSDDGPKSAQIWRLRLTSNFVTPFLPSTMLFSRVTGYRWIRLFQLRLFDSYTVEI